MTSREAVVRRWYEAVDAKEWATLRSLMRDDVAFIVTNNDVVADVNLVGLESVEAWLKDVTAGTDSRHRVRHVGAVDDTAVSIVDLDLRYDGASLSTRVVDIFRFDDDRIVERLRTQGG